MTHARKIDATGDVVVGDIIIFTESVFQRGGRRPQYLGDRTIEARVMRDSYGAEKQQHTFTLEIIKSGGEQPLKAGALTRRKGRNVYRNGVTRAPWENEQARWIAQKEKHARGDEARAARLLGPIYIY
jgi:hypothetical protein